MIVRTNSEVQQLATLLLNTLQNTPALNQPAKAGVKAGLQQAWKCVCAKHETYAEIEKNLPAPEYPVQARAIAVLAVDWLHGEDMDWEQFVSTLIKQPAQ